MSGGAGGFAWRFGGEKIFTVYEAGIGGFNTKNSGPEAGIAAGRRWALTEFGGLRRGYATAKYLQTWSMKNFVMLERRAFLAVAMPTLRYWGLSKGFQTTR